MKVPIFLSKDDAPFTLSLTVMFYVGLLTISYICDVQRFVISAKWKPSILDLVFAVSLSSRKFGISICEKVCIQSADISAS